MSEYRNFEIKTNYLYESILGLITVNHEWAMADKEEISCTVVVFGDKLANGTPLGPIEITSG